jgi:hypothetical protein
MPHCDSGNLPVKIIFKWFIYFHTRLTVNGVLKDSVKKGDLQLTATNLL